MAGWRGNTRVMGELLRCVVQRVVRRATSWHQCGEECTIVLPCRRQFSCVYFVVLVLTKLKLTLPSTGTRACFRAVSISRPMFFTALFGHPGVPPPNCFNACAQYASTAIPAEHARHFAVNALQHTRSMLGVHVDVGQHGLRPSGPAGTTENSNPLPHLDDFGSLHTTGEAKQNGAFVGFLVTSLRHCGHPVQPRASLSVPMVESVAHPVGGGVQASSGQDSKLCTHWKDAQHGALPPFPGGVTVNTVPVKGG